MLVENLGILEGGKQTVDHHGIFVTEYFVDWVKKLLEVLYCMNTHNAMIMVDNAKYNKTQRDDTSKVSQVNQKIIDYCRLKGAPMGKSHLQMVFWGQGQAFVKRYVKFIIASMAKEAGHTVF